MWIWEKMENLLTDAFCQEYLFSLASSGLNEKKGKLYMKKNALGSLKRCGDHK